MMTGATMDGEREFITESLTSAAGCMAGAGAMLGRVLGECLPGDPIKADVQEIIELAADLQDRIEGLASGEVADKTGETLADYVNRNRPAVAPAVHGEAAFSPEDGFTWACGSWRVTVLLHGAGQVEVRWEDLERADQDVIGYALEVDGRRTHTINDPADPGNGLELDGWTGQKAA